MASPRTTLNGNGWGISKDNQHVAETMRFFDFWFTEAGITLNSYGVEGTDYTIVNGVKEYTQQAKDYAGGVPSYMGTFGSREIGIPVSLEAEIKGMNKDAAEGFAMYVEKDYTISEFPNLPFNVEENRVIKERELQSKPMFSRQHRDGLWAIRTLPRRGTNMSMI